MAIKIAFGFMMLLITDVVFCQHSQSDSIYAYFLKEKLVFDGQLNEPFWKNSFAINDFTQRELDYGKHSTDTTKVVIVYDDLALYIGVWCFQQKSTITAKYLQRDFDFTQDDNFQILLSTLNDKRNAYLFIINPNGARADLQVNGDNDNIDWNGVWDAKTTISDKGWFAEIRIPFNTLQFKKDSLQIWSINFERNIRSKKEQDRWQGWSRDYSFENLRYTGKLLGLKNIGYARRFEFKPYLLGGFEKNKNEKMNFPSKFGADVNVNITPTLKLNLTANTDFAQVEADKIQTNLTRFNLYYPEKREFFLEGYNNFQIYLGNNNQLFYTRQIGLEQFQPVPILGGVRLFGKIDRSTIGFLSLETDVQDTVPATNNTVFRYKYDLGTQSYIGGMVTSHINQQSANQVYCLDGNYTTSNFLKNKNLVLSGLIAESVDNYKLQNNSLSYRFYCDYPNDLIDHFIAVSSLPQNFHPSLGFLQRENYSAFNWHLYLAPRWFTKYFIRQLDIGVWDLAYFITQSTGELESWTNQSRPIGFILKSGDRFQWNMQQSYDRLNQPFILSDSAIIPTGHYYMSQNEFLISTYQARRLWLKVSYNFGSFYTGRIQTLATSIGINFSKHLNLSTDYNYNVVNLPLIKVITHQLDQYVNYALSTKVDLSLFAQWNSLEDIMLYNFRFHWIPKIGSDLYAVYNRAYDHIKQLDLLRPTTSTGIAKLVWRFSF
ncbi:MAG: DUF5916 domain-containing protein [Flavisolibacter sp.]